jgi:hypothetical protein
MNTLPPSYEAALEKEFKTWVAEEDDTNPDVPEIELIPKIVWARDPKTKREAKAQCVDDISRLTIVRTSDQRSCLKQIYDVKESSRDHRS